MKLSEDPEREVVIPITVTHLGGASPADHSSLSKSVTSTSEECYEPETRIATGPASGSRSRRPRTAKTTTARALRLGFGTLLPVAVSAGTRARATVRIIDGGEVFAGLAQVEPGAECISATRMTAGPWASATWRGSGSVRTPRPAPTATSPQRKGARLTRTLFGRATWASGQKRMSPTRSPAVRARPPRQPRGTRCCRSRRCPTQGTVTTGYWATATMHPKRTTGTRMASRPDRTRAATC